MSKFVMLRFDSLRVVCPCCKSWELMTFVMPGTPECPKILRFGGFRCPDCEVHLPSETVAEMLFPGGPAVSCSMDTDAPAAAGGGLGLGDPDES